jgi:hypothetical protein
MNTRSIAFIVFGLFVAISAAYVAFELLAAMGLGLYGAVPISGIVFAVTVFLIDRKLK